jgi:hypothetical protein
MKLLVAENFTGTKFWNAFLQAPVEIGFLALTFTATLLIGNPHRAETSLIISFVFIALLFVSILLWKVSPTAIAKRPIVKASLLVLLNFAITVSMLASSVALLIKGVQT